eukprot:1156141-Pelagomonas_calceolata.AAC.4
MQTCASWTWPTKRLSRMYKAEYMKVRDDHLLQGPSGRNQARNYNVKARRAPRWLQSMCTQTKQNKSKQTNTTPDLTAAQWQRRKPAAATHCC